MSNTYLTFTIFGDLYAVPAERVLEVLEKQEYTKVPNAPVVIKGIIDFRGNAIPLYESRTKFNLPERPADANFIIVVINLITENESYHLGVIVDDVNEVLTLDEKDIRAVPPMSKEYNAEFLNGIARKGEQFFLLINIDKIFESSEIKAIKTISKNKHEKA
jgi:purine-binding chemotaxis protein CheW